MQRCLPGRKATRLWRAWRASSGSKPDRLQCRTAPGCLAPKWRAMPPRPISTAAHENSGTGNWIEIGMAETTEKTGEKKLSVAPSKTLSLKGRGVEQGVVRQSFSHGRTKAVVVEKVKSRAPVRSKAEAPAPAAAPAKRPAAGKAATAVAAAG